MNESQLRLAMFAVYAIFLGVVLYFLFKPRGEKGKPIIVQPVMIVNPDGSPVQFGKEPLIQTDEK